MYVLPACMATTTKGQSVWYVQQNVPLANSSRMRQLDVYHVRMVTTCRMGIALNVCRIVMFVWIALTARVVWLVTISPLTINVRDAVIPAYLASPMITVRSVLYHFTWVREAVRSVGVSALIVRHSVSVRSVHLILMCCTLMTVCCVRCSCRGAQNVRMPLYVRIVERVITWVMVDAMRIVANWVCCT